MSHRALMRHALFLIASLALASACANDESAPQQIEASGLSLAARLSPAAPRVGENQLALELRDSAGAPVAGAHVEAAVRMHAMGAMPAMGGPARVRELGDGRYQADFALEMGGTWQVEITTHSTSGAALRAEGSLTVGSPGLRLAAAGSDSDGAAGAPSENSSGDSPGAFEFSPERLQRIGVRTTRVESRPLARTLRLSARVAFDESALTDLSLRTSGWVETLAVAAVGDAVERGQPLLTVYSPELYAAQLELQQAQRSEERAGDGTRRERAGDLLRAAKRRLALLGIAEGDIAALARRSEPLRALPIRSPVSGVIVEKDVVPGASVEAGERLLRIAPRLGVWLEAAVPEGELANVREGDPARVALASDRANPRPGRVVRLSPALAADSRTGTARIALDASVALEPETWAEVEIDAVFGDGLVVPDAAVLRTGERDFVFVALGGGRFTPRAVTLGVAFDGFLEVRAGLAAGEEVVSSGTYLIASESRLRAAISQW